MDIQAIMSRLPHRFPMLLVDRIVDLRPNEGGIGIKNVSANEPFFQGHFPEKMVFPGVLTIEAMAQTAAVVASISLGEIAEGRLVYFMSIDKAKFRRQVVPGDVLELHVNVVRARRAVWRFACEAKVDGNAVAEAELTAMIGEAKEDL